MFDSLLMIQPATLAQMNEFGAESLIDLESKTDAAFSGRDLDSLDSGFYSVEGGVATINIEGALTPKPSFSAMFFGGGNTTYQEIQSAILQAEGDENVKEIIMNVNSVGGSVAGMFETMDQIFQAKKPVKAVLGSVTASAAYGLASQADEIVASSDVARVGSVGIVQRLFVDPEVVSITSSNAPKKAPDASTEEGRESIREELDAIASKFEERIARGRTKATGEEITAEFVGKNFGQGGVLLAEKAAESKMIDEVEQKGLKLVSGSGKNGAKAETTTISLEQKPMNKTELKANHPDLYAEILAEGQATEKDRVVAHVTMAEETGAVDFALACIKDGKSLTEQAVTAKYITAGLNRNDLAASEEDEAAAAAAAEAAAEEDAPKTEAVKKEEEILAAVEKSFGIEAKASQPSA